MEDPSVPSPISLTKHRLSFRANGAPSVFQLGGGESKNLLLFFDELQTHHISAVSL
jgi:hypothetical protein